MAQLHLSRQATSLLFCTPLEIRRAIYVELINVAGIHIVRTDQGDLRLTACVGPDLYAGHDGSERRTTDAMSDDPAWARRLVSSWGPHWECEEIWLRAKGEGKGIKYHPRAAWRNNITILRVCKLMHVEVLELMKELVHFNITDLLTLDALLEIPGALPSNSSHSIPLGFHNSFLAHINKLDVTLRLPLPFFEALDYSHSSKDRPSDPIFEDDLKVWSSLPQRFEQAKELRSLRLWLDHTNKAYWSVVNERSVLSRFESLAQNSYMEVFFDLPKLHPQLEDQQRHYVGQLGIPNDIFASLSPLKIRRILRQRYEGRTDRVGNYYTMYVQDFPHCFGHPVSQHMSIAEMEKWELVMWRAGADMPYILSFIYIE